MRPHARARLKEKTGAHRLGAPINSARVRAAYRDSQGSGGAYGCAAEGQAARTGVQQKSAPRWCPPKPPPGAYPPAPEPGPLHTSSQRRCIALARSAASLYPGLALAGSWAGLRPEPARAPNRQRAKEEKKVTRMDPPVL